MIETSTLQLLTAKMAIYPSEYETPLEVIPEFLKYFSLNPDTLENSRFIFKRNRILDDNSDFFDETLKEEFVDIDKIQTTFHGRTGQGVWCDPSTLPLQFHELCKPLVEIEMEIGNKVFEIRREYSKLFNTLGEMGGIKEAIFFFAGVLFWIFKRGEMRKIVKFEILGKKCEELGKEETERVMDEVEDGIELFKKVSRLGLLGELFFGEEERLLLPLVLMQLKKEQSGEDPGNGEMEVEEAYERLRSKKPESEMQREVKEFILRNLPISLVRRSGRNAKAVTAVEGSMIKVQPYQEMYPNEEDKSLEKNKKFKKKKRAKKKKSSDPRLLKKSKKFINLFN
jgi:hypothetical protein